MSTEPESRSPALKVALICGIIVVVVALVALLPRSREADVQSLIDERIAGGYAVSLVVAVIDQQGTKYYSAGTLERDGGPPADADTLYEIGSVTKTFTALLLSDMLEKGQLQLSDAVRKYLPSTVQVPRFAGQDITLQHLATHTSGLPMVTENLGPSDNPYEDHSEDKVFEILGNIQLNREIGSKFEYSNLGIGLLAIALSRHAGEDYEDMVVQRICEPLGMASTRITLSDALQRRLATGYDLAEEQVSPWNMGSLKGAGDFRSSARDLARYVRANVGIDASPLGSAMRRAHGRLHDQGFGNTRVGLGWFLHKRGGERIVFHPGGTWGYRSFVGFDNKEHRGVVVLSNSTADVTQLGLHILHPRQRLDPLSDEVAIDPIVLDAYVGAFSIEGATVFEFSRQGDALMVKQSGAPDIRIYPESRNTFFYKSIDAKFEFVPGPGGAVDEVILYQFGKTMKGKRIALPDIVEIDPAVLDRYEGRFSIEGGMVFEFRREGDAFLMVKQAGVPELRIYPQSEHTFFYKAVDAKFRFVSGQDGVVNDVILYQFDKRMNGVRMPDHPEVTVDPALLDEYSGTFVFSPTLSFKFFREQDRFLVSQTGARTLQIFPESNTKFFYKEIDAQFTFVRDDDGEVNSVILHQFGKEMTGTRR